MLLVSLYLVVFLGLNSRRGAELVASLLSGALAGELEYDYLAIGPDLQRLELYGATVRDPTSRAVVEVRELACSFSPLPLLQRRLVLTDCVGEDGSILIEQQEAGRIGLVRAFQGDFFRKRRDRRPLTIVFDDVELRRIDVLINTTDLLLLFEQVDLVDGRVVAGGRFPDMVASCEFPRGRMLFSRRLFGRGTGKETVEDAEFEYLRATRPWAAARTRYPRDRSGMLELEFVGGAIEGFHWIREDFRIERFAVRALDGLFRLEASGLLGVLPQRPRWPVEQASGIRFDGRMQLWLHPDSSVLDWFFPGVFDPPSRRAGVRPEVEALQLDGWGSLQFADLRPTRLRMRDATVLGWLVDSIDVGVAVSGGQIALAPDSSVELAGGVVRAGGNFEPETGRWSVDACIDNVDVGELAAPWVDSSPDSALTELLDLRLSSASEPCATDGSGAPVDLRLSGDLTRKALAIAPGADVPLGAVLQPPMLSVDAPALRMRWGRRPLGLPLDALEVGLAATLDQRGRIELGDPSRPGLRVRGGGERLSFGGAIDTVSSTIEKGRVQLASAALERWVAAAGGPQLPPDLAITLDAAVAGPFDAPQIRSARVTASSPAESGFWPPFEGTLVARIDGDDLRVESLGVRTPYGALETSGSVRLFDGSPFRTRETVGLDLAWDLADMDVARWTPLLGPDALLDARGRVSGSTASPQLAADFVAIRDAQLGDEPFARIDAVGLVAGDRRVAVESLTAPLGDGIARGHFAWDASTDAVAGGLVARGVDLRDVRTLAALGLPVRGAARIDLAVRGTAADPDVEGAFLVRGLEVGRRRIGHVSLALDTWDDHVHVVGGVDGTFSVDLALPTSLIGDDPDPVTLSVAFERAPVERYWPAFGRSVAESRFTGRLDASWDPDTGDARADLGVTDAHVQIGSQVLGVARPVRASWELGHDDGVVVQRVRIHELATVVDDRELVLRGTVLLDPRDPRVSLSLGGLLDFSLLQLFPQLVVDAEGLADLSLKVFGPLAEPAIDGEAIFGEARIAPRGLGTSIQLDPGAFRIETGRLVIDAARPVTGTLFGGDLSLHGELGLDGLNPSSADFSAFVTDLVYRVPESFVVTLTGPVRFQAPSLRDYDTWSVGGDLTLVDGRFLQDFEIISDQFAFGGIGRGVEAFSLPVWMRVPAIGRMNADLSLRGRDRFYVRSRVAGAQLDVEFRTELEVTGRIEAMDVRGELEALDGGTVDFRGRTFDVTEMLLGFRGVRDAYGYPMPYLDAEMTASMIPCAQGTTTGLGQVDGGAATADSNRVFLTAFLNGQLPYDISFRLESTPFYDQRDQLSLIVTGCTVDALTAGTGGAPTLDAVLQPFLDVVERNVEERLALDQVDVAPTADGTAGVQIQDEVTERFRWTLDALFGSGESNRQVVRGEYRLFDWLVLEVQEQTSGDEPVRVDTGVRFRVVFD